MEDRSAPTGGQGDTSPGGFVPAGTGTNAKRQENYPIPHPDSLGPSDTNYTYDGGAETPQNQPEKRQNCDDANCSLGTNRRIPAAVDFKGVFDLSKCCGTFRDITFSQKVVKTTTQFNIDHDTGEIVSKKETYDPVALRLERFALQAASRKILSGTGIAKGLQTCLRRIIPRRSTVEIWRSKAHQKAFYIGLQTCAGVWVCPVCAAKISERRRVELLAGIENHKANGGATLLLTLTNPHDFGDCLRDMLAGQKVAMDALNSHRQGKKLWADMGRIGWVRAWEVTVGENGWHSHYHLLLFVRAGLDLEAFRTRIYSVWAHACRLAGLPVPTEDHGVCLHDGGEAASYASKWGVEHEMTKGHIKKARAGRTPFDLLRSYLHEDDRQAAALFKEFANAFRSCHQLQWSRGLKARLAIEDQTDKELAAAQDDHADILGEIRFEEWRAIIRLDIRAELLELARFGWEPVRRLLDSLPRATP